MQASNGWTDHVMMYVSVIYREIFLILFTKLEHHFMRAVDRMLRSTYKVTRHSSSVQPYNSQLQVKRKFGCVYVCPFACACTCVLCVCVCVCVHDHSWLTDATDREIDTSGVFVFACVCFYLVTRLKKNTLWHDDTLPPFFRWSHETLFWAKAHYRIWHTLQPWFTIQRWPLNTNILKWVKCFVNSQKYMFVWFKILHKSTTAYGIQKLCVNTSNTNTVIQTRYRYIDIYYMHNGMAWNMKP